MALASLLAFINRIRNRKYKPVSGSVYDFKMKSLKGETVDFNQFRGKKLLIVNTASKCVYTTQLHELQQLHENYGKSVNILGFPSNDFLWQEPGTSSEIESFCSINYGVTFLMFEKISVKGKHMHKLFQWLAGKTSKVPSWNFCKYLLDENGNVIEFFPSQVNPLSRQITDKIT